MNYREIPATAVEVQTGLWADLYSFNYNGTTYSRYNLYAAEGYCFYIPANNLDEEGNLLPENERTYYVYAASGCRTIEEVNTRFVSVPYQDGYEIAGGGNDHETA